MRYTEKRILEDWLRNKGIEFVRAKGTTFGTITTAAKKELDGLPITPFYVAEVLGAMGWRTQKAEAAYQRRLLETVCLALGAKAFEGWTIQEANTAVKNHHPEITDLGEYTLSRLFERHAKIKGPLAEFKLKRTEEKRRGAQTKELPENIGHAVHSQYGNIKNQLNDLRRDFDKLDVVVRSAIGKDGFIHDVWENQTLRMKEMATELKELHDAQPRWLSALREALDTHKKSIGQLHGRLTEIEKHLGIEKQKKTETDPELASRQDLFTDPNTNGKAS